MVQRTVTGFLKRLLSVNDTPERISLAFAIGVFLAFSPLLGLQTILALGIAFLFNLNRVAILIGAFVNNPWTLVPIYAAGTYVGGILMGFPATTALPILEWGQVWSSNFWVELGRQWQWILRMALGSSILGVISSLLSYPLVLFVIRQRSRRLHP